MTIERLLLAVSRRPPDGRLSVRFLFNPDARDFSYSGQIATTFS